jgi:hypothetical protein
VNIVEVRRNPLNSSAVCLFLLFGSIIQSSKKAFEVVRKKPPGKTSFSRLLQQISVKSAFKLLFYEGLESVPRYRQKSLMVTEHSGHFSRIFLGE